MTNLNENNGFGNPYEREEDISMPNCSYTRKKTLHLYDINKMKRLRNKKREEMAQDSVFIPLIYGPNMGSEGGDMGGMGGMPM